MHQLLAALLVLFPTLGFAEHPSELPGPLVIVGGGKVPDDARKEFVKLAGRDNAKIVVIPTASASADDAKEADAFVKAWKDLEPASVVVLHTRDKKTADSADFVKPLTDATGVWFGGGDQTKIMAAYRGTLVETDYGGSGKESDGGYAAEDFDTGGGDTGEVG